MTARKRPALVRIASRTTASGTEILDVFRDSDRFTVIVWKKKGAGWTHCQKLELFADEINWLRAKLSEAAAGADPTEPAVDLADVVIPEALPS